MSIADELREYVQGWRETPNLIDELDVGDIDGLLGDFEHIADRIDAEHEKAVASVMNDALYYANDKDMAEYGWIRLPLDADGVPIRVGDTVTCARSVWEVTGLRLTGLAWGVCCTIFNDHGGSGTNVYPPCDLHHYHAPTVEDVMVEFATDWESAQDGDDKTAVLKEYAAKLRLAEEVDA